MKRQLKSAKPPRRHRGSVDPEKLHAALRGLDRDSLLDVLDRALKLIPRARLAEVAGARISPEDLAPDSDLVAKVAQFCEASRRGDFYDSFHVDSKNFMQKSLGTQRWIAECGRLFDRCLTQAEKLGPAQTRKALMLLLDLLRSIDKSDDAIVFWADEGGSWQAHVDWKKVMPLWFRSLAATTPPEEYAREAVSAIDDFADHDRERYLKLARSAGNREQRSALK